MCENEKEDVSGLGYKTPSEYAAGCIVSASVAPSPQQYIEYNVDNSLIACGT